MAGGGAGEAEVVAQRRAGVAVAEQAALLQLGAGVPEVWLATALLNAAVVGWIGVRWRRAAAAP